ncbi:MAG: hypothetical protein KJO65_07730, partial [Gemmatimonadetes bacterium]|nr:hypothetical protein [Gemmatimonadota bacterium]
MPIGFGAALAAIIPVFPQVALQPVVERSFLAAAMGLIAGAVVLFASATRRKRDLSMRVEIKT